MQYGPTLGASAGGSSGGVNMPYDLKIINANIVDGTGLPRFFGEVGIADGKIVAMGGAPGPAREVIDGRGLIAAPGFVDIHTHYDAQILWDRMLSISPWHGVTTAVMGNCGFGLAPTRPDHRPLIIRTLEKVEGMSRDALEAGLGSAWSFESFPDYLDAIEKRGTAINVAVLMGHTPLRLYVMGEEATEREASAPERDRMEGILREGLEAGALGFATSKSPTHLGFGGKPVASRASSLDEIKALATVMGNAGRGVMQATIGRELGPEQFAEIARAAGITISWTALLSGTDLGGVDHREMLRQSHKVLAAGLPVIPQVTPRPLTFEFQFVEPFPFESLSLFRPVASTDAAGKKRLYADAEFRRSF